MTPEEAGGLHAILENPHTWVYLGFLIFVVLAGPKIWKALAQMLDRRSLKIKSDLDEAQKLKDEAQALLAEYQRKQRDAMREAEEIISNAKALAQRQIKDAGKKLEENLARREKASLEKIHQAEAAALAEVRREAVDVATAAAAQIIRSQIDGVRGGALIDRAIAEVEKKLH
ncbi:F0F1 ATP synthase subunit B family protein [Dongia deserti]|uniref:F0F1 ATP synthase subunit B family protein n=1 Tax=Dongia deserti TaxID=2268030 RepID=UPI000E64DF36|nr:F0F1 ATP synthase subunit B [Dongia deserti]